MRWLKSKPRAENPWKYGKKRNSEHFSTDSKKQEERASSPSVSPGFTDFQKVDTTLQDAAHAWAAFLS